MGRCAGEGEGGLEDRSVPKKRSAKKAVPKPKARRRAKTLTETYADFTAVFDGLKNVMGAFACELRPTADEPRKYYLVTKANSWKGGPMFFGAVMMGKAYVSYHLMPLYACPELVKTVSSDLKKRMQGKSCFNFRAPDEALFAELSELTKAGLEKYRAKNWF
jgi:hypothetical protein